MDSLRSVRLGGDLVVFSRAMRIHSSKLCRLESLLFLFCFLGTDVRVCVCVVWSVSCWSPLLFCPCWSWSNVFSFFLQWRILYDTQCKDSSP